MRSPRPEKSATHPIPSGAADRVCDLYEQYAPRIAAYALRRTSRVDAADVVAETFLVAWRRRDDIPAEPMALPWLYGVARRVLANQIRARHRRTRLHDRLVTQFTHHQAPSRLEVAEGFQSVATALKKLSNDDAEILRLTAWEDLTPSEIASMMNLEPEAVRQRLHRARKRLRKHLGADDPHVVPAKTNGRARQPSFHAPVAGTHLGTLGFGGGGQHG